MAAAQQQTPHVDLNDPGVQTLRGHWERICSPDFRKSIVQAVDESLEGKPDDKIHLGTLMDMIENDPSIRGQFMRPFAESHEARIDTGYEKSTDNVMGQQAIDMIKNKVGEHFTNEDTVPVKDIFNAIGVGAFKADPKNSAHVFPPSSEHAAILEVPKANEPDNTEGNNKSDKEPKKDKQKPEAKGEKEPERPDREEPQKRASMTPQPGQGSGSGGSGGSVEQMVGDFASTLVGAALKAPVNMVQEGTAALQGKRNARKSVNISDQHAASIVHAERTRLSQTFDSIAQKANEGKSITDVDVEKFHKAQQNLSDMVDKNRSVIEKNMAHDKDNPMYKKDAPPEKRSPLLNEIEDSKNLMEEISTNKIDQVMNNENLTEDSQEKLEKMKEIAKEFSEKLKEMVQKTITAMASLVSKVSGQSPQ